MLGAAVGAVVGVAQGRARPGQAREGGDSPLQLGQLQRGRRSRGR